MGFNHNDLRFLLTAEGPISSICTLGRLTLFSSQAQLNKVTSEFGKRPITLPKRAVHYADDALAPLGFAVDSVDFSDYEQASIVLDLNLPVPSHLAERFDAVWDGGTLEHIFDFPTALANALKMVRVGGHFMARTPANNQCGHGFYQFSPELFYRVLCAQNGFSVERMYIKSRNKFYHVKDPQLAGGRVELLDCAEAMLVIDARKIAPTPDRLTIPQQSDYAATWSADNKPNDGAIKAKLRKRLSPETIEQISYYLNKIRIYRNVRAIKKRARLSNRSVYMPVDDWRLPTRSAFD